MDMSNILMVLSGIFVVMILISFFNEKVVKLPSEIGLMTISLVASVVIIVLSKLNVPYMINIEGFVNKINFHDLILSGFLCFLLFSGSATIRLKDLKKDKLLIGSLAFVSTLIATLIYACLALVVAKLVNVELTFIQGCVLGSIIAPTDPISAMSILKKAGLPERLSIIMEGESLFNDGMAVALFITFSSLMKTSGGNPAVTFMETVGWNVLGAIGTGLIISIVLFFFFKRTKQKYLEILISLAAVTLAYSISERIEVSGPTAAVVVGIFFATQMNKMHENNEEYYSNFYTFWKVIDKILNAFLYILIGVAVILLKNIHGGIIIGISAIIIALIARYVSVLGPIDLFSRSSSMRKESYTKEIRKHDRSGMAKLLTWAGLKGGICIALALGTKELFTTDQYFFVVISTYAVVIFSTLIQGLTVKRVYRRLERELCQSEGAEV